MDLGGADRQVMLLARELKRRGHMVRVVSLLPGGDMADDLKGDAVQVDSLGFNRKFELPKAVAQLRAQIRTFQPDVVHAHMFHANMLARITRLFTPVDAVVSTSHNVYESDPHQGSLREVTARERLYRLTDFLSEITTNVAQVGTDRYVRVGAVPKEKSKTIHQGMDVSKFHKDSAARERIRSQQDIGEKEFVWLAVGTLTEQKDFTTLLKAVAKQPASGKVWILGKGKLRSNLEQLTSELGIKNRVQFHGSVPPNKVRGYMNAADAFVLSSRWEGMPLVLLEAMACELPIVSTRSGGSEELVNHGETGLLVPTQSPNELARGMEQLMETDEQYRHKMGHSGRERVVKHFSIESIADEWENIYHTVTSGEKTRTAGDI